MKNRMKNCLLSLTSGYVYCQRYSFLFFFVLFFIKLTVSSILEQFMHAVLRFNCIFFLRTRSMQSQHPTHGSGSCFLLESCLQALANGGTSGYLFFVYQVSCYVFNCLGVTSCSSKLLKTQEVICSVVPSFTFSIMFQEPNWKIKTINK